MFLFYTTTNLVLRSEWFRISLFFRIKIVQMIFCILQRGTVWLLYNVWHFKNVWSFPSLTQFIWKYFLARAYLTLDWSYFPKHKHQRTYAVFTQFWKKGPNLVRWNLIFGGLWKTCGLNSEFENDAEFWW